jgi:hypothetical protein
MPADKKLLEAVTSFAGGLPDGSTLYVQEGRTRIWSTHPAAKKWPDAFREVGPTDTYNESRLEPSVEQATAAPGEKRG